MGDVLVAYISKKRRVFKLPKIFHVLRYVSPINVGVFLFFGALFSVITVASIRKYNLLSIVEPTVVAQQQEQTHTLGNQSPTTNSHLINDSSVAAGHAESVGSSNSRAHRQMCNKVKIEHPDGLALQQLGFTQIVEAPRYYPVYGQSIAELRTQLSHCGPNGYFASTNYQLNWVYSTQILSNGQCQLTNVRVGMHIIVQYPAWQTSQSADTVTRQQWNTMMRNLVAHEEGHVSRNVTIANELTSTLQNLPPTTCNTIVAQVQSITSQYTLKLHSAHGAYDSATNHGETQGAWL